MNPSALKSEFDDRGFVAIRGFLQGEELSRLRNNVDRYIREVVPTLSEGDAFYDDRSRPETLKQLHRMEQDAFFREYLSHPLWKTAAEALLGEPVRIPTGVEWFNKPPGTQHATPPHQDNYYFCLKPPLVLTMWLALDEVDEENGCLRYVPGSHQRGVRPHSRTSTLGFSQGVNDYGDADRSQEIALPAEPGDVLIHHGNTIHRADANRSTTRHRRSFGMVFHGVSSQRDEAAFRQYTQSLETQHANLR